MTSSNQPERRSLLATAKQPSYKKSDKSVEEGKCTETLFQYLGYFMMFVGFAPLFIGQFVDNFKIAASAAMGVAIFSACLSLVMYKLGRTNSWPKPIDVMFFILFGIQTIVVFAKPESNDFWRFWGGAYFNFCAAFLIVVLWVLGKPFTKPYVEDMYGLVAATHPFSKHAIRIGTTIWLITFFLIGLLSLPGGISQASGNPSDAALAAATIGTPILFVSALVASFVGLPWYLHAYQGKIFERKQNEVLEWNAKHPDEKFAKAFEEQRAEGEADVTDVP